MANYTSTHTGATIDASVTIVSGSGVTQSDLTKLNAVTSSAIELNILDGVTASTAEINILDGLTATTAELNYLDGADSSITTLSLPDNTTITTFGASLIDDADAATARTTLGVDVAGTDNSTDVTLVTTSHDYLSISGQAITLGSIDISDDTNLTGGTGITLTGDTLSTTDSEIVHDNLSGFVANEHIDHSTVSISAGSGLSGGGDLTSTRTLSIDSSVVTLSATQTLSNKSISGTANTISNVHIVDDTINTLTIARGGTGGTTSAEARSNLNVDVAGTDNSTDVTLVTTSHDYLSLSGQAITLGEIDISDDTNLVGGTGITLTGDTLSTTDSEIVHDNLSGFVSNEHIDHSTVSITAGTGLSGGGDITTSRTLTTDDSAIVHDNLSGFVANEHIDHSGVSITAGAGLTGGGDITATRDIAVGAGTGVTVNADDIAIGQDVGTSADVEFNSVTADIIGDIRGATKFQAKADVALNKGDAVYISGVSGTTPTVDIADANDSAKMPSFGLAASSVSINASVEIITFGTLAGLNTSGFSVGDILYISTNGTSGNTLTATPPTGETSLIQNIGKVQRSHASAGSIKVGGAGRSNATPNLNDGNIFIGNGSNQAVTASLNTKIEDYLDGGTSTANFDTISVDGAEITATPAELNVLDGITSTTAELNHTDGVTSNIQTQLDAKAPLASPAFTGTATGANLTLSGDLTVNGSTTTLDTTNLAVEDNLMELNAGVTSNANDSGFLIERGSTGDNAIFMWDESADKFTLGTTTATGTTTGDITLSSTGTLVANVEGDVTGAVTGNADTATTLATARNFSLTGDVTAGAVSFDGSGNVALSTTIAANSVALGTDTTGNYISDLTEGTGIDISHTPGEGSNGTITLDLTEVGFGGGANRLITDDGDGTVTAEANLTFDGNHLLLPDTGNIKFGDSNDLRIRHDGSNSIIQAEGTGNLVIRQDTADADILLRCDDGAGGITDYITLDGSLGYTTSQKDFRLLADNINLSVGASTDLYFYHDGTNSWMRNKTGNLYIRNEGDDNDIYIQVDDGGGNNTTAIQIDASEIGRVKLPNDNQYLSIGASGDLYFFHDGTNSVIRNATGDLVLRNDEADQDIILQTDDGSGGIATYITLDGSATSVNIAQDVKLDATKRLYLDGTAGQTYITESQNDVMDFYAGGVQMLRMEESGTDYVTAPDNIRLSVGTDKDSQWYYSGTNTIFSANNSPSLYITQYTTDGDIIFQSDNGSGGTTNYLQIDGGAENIYVYKDLRLAATKKLYLDGGGNTYIFEESADNVIHYVGGQNKLRFNSTGTILNDAGLALDFRVEGDTDPNLFFVDGSADRVGIGTSSPSAKLEVASGNSGGDGALDSPTIRINNTTASSDWDSGDVIGTLEWYASDTSGNAPYVTSFIKSVNETGNGTLPGGALTFGTSAYNAVGGATEAMRIDDDGNVGIGTTSPAHKLEVEVDTNVFVGFDNSIGGTTGDKIMFVGWGGSNAYGRIQPIHQGTAYKDLVLNDSGGNVGIGETSPSTPLHINSGTGNIAATFESTDAGSYINIIDNGSGSFGAMIGAISDDIVFSPNNVERLRIDSQGNLKFSDNGTNPSAAANTAFMFNDGGELKVLDELGNTTTISPHNFDLIPGGASEDRAWGYYSEKDIVDDEGNVTATQKVNVDMMKLARLVEELTGEKLVYTEED